MIYNIEIGFESAHSLAPVVKENEQRNNTFICFDNINQKIRIGPSCKDLSGIKTEDFIVTNINGGYIDGDNTIPVNICKCSLGSLDTKYKWVNNRKNLNPLFVANKKSSEELILFITLSNNIKVLSYYTEYRILHSYGKKDKYSGCAVVLNSKELKNNSGGDAYDLFTIKFLDTLSERFKIASIAIDTNNNISVSINDASGIDLKRMRAVNKKYPNSLKMRIRVKNHELLTQCYICDKEHTRYLDSLLDGEMPQWSQIIIDTSKDEKTIFEELDDNLECLEKDHVSAITTVGITVPIELYKKHKISNVFDYDIENDILRCKR